jgi:hypothetical protein
VRPASSVNSRKAGEAEETAGAVCARATAAPHKKAAMAVQTAVRRPGQTIPFTKLLRREILLEKLKSPARRRGASGNAPSREERGPLRHGRVAWLTAFQPITVAGPRPIRTAFPASLACKLKFECKPRTRGCQCAFERLPRKLSDSSNWACAFPPGRGDLPANPRAGTARSGRYSWNA